MDAFSAAVSVNVAIDIDTLLLCDRCERYDHIKLHKQGMSSPVMLASMSQVIMLVVFTGFGRQMQLPFLLDVSVPSSQYDVGKAVMIATRKGYMLKRRRTPDSHCIPFVYLLHSTSYSI